MEPVNELEFWKLAAETQKNNNLKLIEENRKLREEREEERQFWKEAMREQAKEYIDSLQSIQQERDKLIEERDYFRDNRSELFWQVKQQVNTLTAALEKIATSKSGLASSLKTIAVEALQSIKESPREEQTK